MAGDQGGGSPQRFCRKELQERAAGKICREEEDQRAEKQRFADGTKIDRGYIVFIWNREERV